MFPIALVSCQCRDSCIPNPAGVRCRVATDSFYLRLQSRMVSRTAVAIVALVALAAGVYSQNDGSTTGQFINKFVPLTVEIVSTGVANFVVTPATLVSPCLHCCTL